MHLNKFMVIVEAFSETYSGNDIAPNKYCSWRADNGPL